MTGFLGSTKVRNEASGGSSVARSRRRGSAPILAVALALAPVAAHAGGAVGPVKPAAPAEPAQPRTLVLAFDCLPYETAARLADPGRGDRRVLAGLRGPVPLISSFPSTTSVAFGGILAPLGLERSPGYEARFFDRRRRKVMGGMLFSYFRIPFAWRDVFDWNRKSPPRRMMAALRPAKTTRAWFAAAIAAFQRSHRPLFLVYNGATDTLAHLGGPAAFEPVLVELEAMLAEARRQRPFRVVLLSDHGLAGGEPLRNVFKPVKRALAEAGFRYRRRLAGPRDVALTPFGLVSSFELYTAPAAEAPVARAVAAVEGVDLCVRRAAAAAGPADGTAIEASWVVSSAAGEARVGRRASSAGREWAYRPSSGDPLGYGELSDGSWRSDRWWLETTAGHRYPDALHRMALAFELVENPASIVCSTDARHMFGARKTDFASRLTGGRLRWTHGALERQATLGFLMADDPRLPLDAAVRFDEALAPLARPAPPR